jgi:ankyrin repeat protein
MIKTLVAAGASKNAKNQKGDTVLHLAAWQQDLKVLQTLIDAQADTNATNYYKLSNLRKIGELINAETNLYAVNKQGYCAMQLASQTKQAKDFIDLLSAARAEA